MGIKKPSIGSIGASLNPVTAVKEIINADSPLDAVRKGLEYGTNVGTLGQYGIVKDAVKDQYGQWKDKAGNALDAKSQAEAEAMARQQDLMNQALKENAYGGDRYYDAQRQIMDQQISGNAPQATAAEVQSRMQTLQPQINQNYSGNMWSTARQKATSNASLQAANDISNQKNNMQLGAMDRLREEASNRANNKLGQAGQVQAKSTWMDKAGDVLGLMNGITGVGANGVAIKKGLAL